MGENIFNRIDKGLVSRTYKQLMQIHIKKKTKQLKLKMRGGSNRHFSKEHVQVTKRHMKRCSVPLIIREMQIKTTMRCHFTLIFGLPWWLSWLKKSACNVGNLGLIPGLGRSPGEGKGYPLQYSGLENSVDCIVPGVKKSQTRLSDFHFHSHDQNGHHQRIYKQ